MKKKLLSALIALMFFTNFAFSQICSTCSYPGWNHYRKIVINNSTNPSALTNFQVLVSLNTQSIITAGKMQANGNDIRFSSLCSGGTNYNYWIESGINTTLTKIWVKVPAIAANSVDTMYLHFGNPAATAAASGSLTFDLFDDFESGLVGWTFSGGTWNITNVGGSNVLTCTNPTAGNGFAALRSTALGLTNYYVETSTRVSANTVYGGPMFEHNDFNNYFAYHYMVDMQNTMQSKITGGTANYSISDPAVVALNTWYPWSMKRTPTIIDLTFNSVFTRTLASSFTDGAGVWAYGGGAGLVHHDNFRVRKQSTVTPTITLGVEYGTTPTVLSLNTSTNIICLGGQVTFTASGLNTYTWSTGPTTNTIAASPAVNTSYSVTGTNTLVGCTNTAAVTITVNGLPSVAIAGGTAAICNGSSATLTASGANTYSWNNGPTTNTIAPSPSVTTNYTVVGTNTVTGCSNSAVKTITVNALPSVAIAGGTAAICNGSFANLTASGADTYSWSNGPTTNTIAISPSVTTNYTVVGTNTVTGCSNSAVKTITVNALPSVAIAGGTAAICNGSSATLTASGANTYSWSNGPVTNTIAPSPSVTTNYTVVGTNTVTGCSNSAVKTITVNALPSVAITGGTAAICSGSSATLTAGGANTYSWSNGPVTNTIAPSPTVTTNYTVVGTNTVTGCSNNAVKTITVNALPSVVISGTTEICTGSSATLTAGGANTYSWSNGPTTNTIAISPTITTNYSVVGTSSVTGCSNTAVTTLTVNALPVVTISGPTDVCIGSSITLTAGGANSYSWSNGPTTTTIAASPTITTNYSVVGTNSITGCTNSTTTTITVNSLPSVAITGGTAAICSGSSATLSAGGANTYSWSNGGNTNVISISPTVTTSYSVTGTNTVTGCSNTAMQTLSVNPLPNISISPASFTICKGESVQLNSSGGITYTWSTGPNSASISISPSVTTSYSVTGTDANGCTGNSSVNITVDECTGIKVIAANPAISVYPNPTKEVININMTNVDDNTFVEMFNSMGQLIQIEKMKTKEFTLSLNNKSNGVYLIRVRSTNTGIIGQTRIILEN